MKYNNEFTEALKMFNLKPDYTEAELRRAHHKIIFNIHPDRTSEDGEKAKIVNAAYHLLLQEVRKGNKEKIEKEKNIFISAWKNDIRALQSKYSNFKEVLNLCKQYLEIIDKLQTIEELKLQKEEFNEKIKVIKERIYYQAERDNFKKSLLFTIKVNKDDDFSKLAIYYLELIGNVYTLQELKKLESEYEKKAIQLKEEKRLKELQVAREKFLEELKDISEKYQDKKTIDLVNNYNQQLNEQKEKEKIEALQKKFQAEFKMIRKEELDLLERKNSLKDYFHKFQELEYQELVEKYITLTTKTESSQELFSLRREFDNEIKKIKNQKRAEEKKLNDLIITLKDKTKRFLIYHFYKSSLSLSIDKIILEVNILKESLDLLETASSNELEITIDFFSKFRFQNFQEEMGKLNFFHLMKEKKFQNEAEIKDFLTSFKEKSIVQDEVEELPERKKVKDNVMKSFYYYATATSLKEIVVSFENLDKVLDFLQKIDDDTFLRNISKIEQISFQNMPLTKEIIDSLKPSNKIFISYLDGEIATMDKLDDKILVTPLDTLKPVQVISNRKAEIGYISLAEFFKRATFVGGREVLERINQYETRPLLYIYGTHPLYIYKNIMLEYKEISSSRNAYFDFYVSKSKDGFTLNNNGLASNDISKNFSDRTYCEKMVMEQFSKELENDKYLENTQKK